MVQAANQFMGALSKVSNLSLNLEWIFWSLICILYLVQMKILRSNMRNHFYYQWQIVVLEQMDHNSSCKSFSG